MNQALKCLRHKSDKRTRSESPVEAPSKVLRQRCPAPAAIAELASSSCTPHLLNHVGVGHAGWEGRGLPATSHPDSHNKQARPRPIPCLFRLWHALCLLIAGPRGHGEVKCHKATQSCDSLGNKPGRIGTGWAQDGFPNRAVLSNVGGGPLPAVAGQTTATLLGK